MDIFERILKIADGLKEIIGDRKATVAIEATAEGISEILIEAAHKGESKNISIVFGTAVVFGINGITFALTEKKINPQMN